MVDGHGIFDAYYELDIWQYGNLSILEHLMCLNDVDKIKGLDLWLDLIGQRLRRTPPHKLR